MQTFIVDKDFDIVAQELDSRRLNKQILEGYQILKVLNNPDPRAAWRNHPAVLMWKGHEHGLHTYIKSMIKEADKRGIKTDKNSSNIAELKSATVHNWGEGFPAWYSSEKFIRIITTHKANLYKKDPEYYWQFQEYVYDENNKPCCDKCQYFWITHEERNNA